MKNWQETEGSGERLYVTYAPHGVKGLNEMNKFKDEFTSVNRDCLADSFWVLGQLPYIVLFQPFLPLQI